MIYIFNDEKSAEYNTSGSGVKNENEQLANKLHKLIIRKFSLLIF